MVNGHLKYFFCVSVSFIEGFSTARGGGMIYAYAICMIL